MSDEYKAGLDAETERRVWERVFSDSTTKQSTLAAEPNEGEAFLLGCIEHEYNDYRYYSELAKRFKVRETKKRFEAVAAEERGHLQRLSAAYFIMAGDSPHLNAFAGIRTATTLAALRERYIAEEAAIARYLEGAAQEDDPSLSSLYRELANEERVHSRYITQLLEQLMQ